jgi:type I restriction enzyme S subunit
MSEGIKLTDFGHIPVSWDIKQINEVTTYVDYRGKTPPKVDSGILLITARNIKMGKIDYNVSQEYIPSELYETVMSRGTPKLGDVLITTEAPLGNVASIDKENIALAQRVIKYRGKKDVLNNSYLKYFMLGPIFQNMLDKQSSGSTVKGIKGSILHKLNLIIPPLPEQQKIAEILSTVDAKIEVIDQQITETQALKKGLMQRLLTKGIGHMEFKDSVLGEIPKSWEVVDIQQLIDQGRIISHLDGNHGGLYPNADEFINEGVPYIGANCFLNNRVDFLKCKYLSMERSLKFRKGVAKNGDVLFAHNATVGPVAFLETELDFVILSTTATYFRLDNKTIDAKYWMFFLSSPTFKNQYEKVMGQSTRNQVPITMQRTFYSVLPTFEEQKEISEILNTSDEKLEILLEKKTHYQELKQGLMQQLLTGKIRVNNLIAQI